jgi:hypothetical protein
MKLMFISVTGLSKAIQIMKFKFLLLSQRFEFQRVLVLTIGLSMILTNAVFAGVCSSPTTLIIDNDTGELLWPTTTGVTPETHKEPADYGNSTIFYSLFNFRSMSNTPTLPNLIMIPRYTDFTGSSLPDFPEPINGSKANNGDAVSYFKKFIAANPTDSTKVVNLAKLIGINYVLSSAIDFRETVSSLAAKNINLFSVTSVDKLGGAFNFSSPAKGTINSCFGLNTSNKPIPADRFFAEVTSTLVLKFAGYGNRVVRYPAPKTGSQSRIPYPLASVGDLSGFYGNSSKTIVVESNYDSQFFKTDHSFTHSNCDYSSLSCVHSHPTHNRVAFPESSTAQIPKINLSASSGSIDISPAYRDGPSYNDGDLQDYRNRNNGGLKKKNNDALTQGGDSFFWAVVIDPATVYLYKESKTNCSKSSCYRVMGFHYRDPKAYCMWN